MKPEELELMQEIIDALSNRMDAMEARAVSTDIMLGALMEHSPNLHAALASIEMSLDPALVHQSDTPEIVRQAQTRTRRFVDLYRRGLAEAQE